MNLTIKYFAFIAARSNWLQLSTRLPAGFLPPGRLRAFRGLTVTRTNLAIKVSMLCLLTPALLPGETIIIQGNPSNVASAAIGVQVGNLARSVIDYKQLRNSHKANIAILEQKVAQEVDSGQKAELQGELDYWKHIDQLCSKMEGDALRAIGITGIHDFNELGRAMIQGLNNLEQYQKQQAAQKRLDFATSVRERFARSAKKQPGDDKLLAYSPVELLTTSEMNRELFFKAVQDPKVKEQIEADWKAKKLVKNDPF
jgi:hypothetical protein